MIEKFLPSIFMAIEILVSEFVFSFLLNRKKYFWARFLGASAVVIVVTLWVEIIFFILSGNIVEYGQSNGIFDTLFHLFYFLGIFAITCITVWISYKGSIWSILFCCSGAYATQHLCKNISYFLIFTPLKDMFWIKSLIEFLICGLVYALIYFVFIKNKKIEKSFNVRSKVIISLIAIIICVGLSRISTDDASRSTTAMVAELLYAVIACALVIFNLFSLNNQDKLKNDLEIMNEIINRERNQYEISKKTIDLINIKCHDLKHQIQMLRNEHNEKNVEELEKCVMIYDSTVKTGNEVLDVILTEKSLICVQNQISLTCVANAKSLAFMDEMDLYSLFGNALTNAIESVSLLEDKNKRCISLNVFDSPAFVSIHIENYFNGKATFKDGKPITSKDSNYHGFGVRSMEFITNKYNGVMTFSTTENKFKLDFLFPLN